MSDLALLVAGTIIAAFFLHDPGEEIEPKASKSEKPKRVEQQPVQAAVSVDVQPQKPAPSQPPAAPESPSSTSPQVMESQASNE